MASAKWLFDTMSPKCRADHFLCRTKAGQQAKSPIVIALGILGSAHLDIGRDILHCASPIPYHCATSITELILLQRFAAKPEHTLDCILGAMTPMFVSV